MKQNQQFRGMGLILLVMALIFFASTLTQQGSLFSDEMTYQEFMTSVENGAIETALIRQNAQTPTGVIMTILKDGERGRIAVSDVMEVQQLFREKGIDYLVDDVPKDNYLMTIILPIGLSAVVIMFLMMYMNARIGGGGGNSKMMNFGKSPCNGMHCRGPAYNWLRRLLQLPCWLQNSARCLWGRFASGYRRFLLYRLN